MTLNTFHFAGVSSKNVTLGVPRLKEVINLVKKIKTPSLVIYLRKQYQKSPEKARELQSKLEYTTLRDIAELSDVYFDPNPEETIIEEDSEFVSTYYDFPDEEIEDMSLISPWLLRLELSKKSMLDKNLRLSDIKRRIRESFTDKHLLIVVNHDNAEKLIVRIRIMNDDGTTQEEKAEQCEVLKNIEQVLLDDLPLKGIP